MTRDDILVLEDPEPFIDPEVLTKFPFSFLQRNCLIPLRDKERGIIVAIDDPLRLDPGEIQAMLGEKFIVARAPAEKIRESLERHYYRPTSEKRIIEDLKDETIVDIQDELGESGNLLDLANKAPVIRLVNQIIYRAISMRASDIHLQSLENSFKVRYRIDGVLHDIFILPKRYQPAVLSRVKIMSDLDIAEKRVPQDGRTSIKTDGAQIDIRVSIMPTFFGESAVLRLLDRTTFFRTMDELGLRDHPYELFNRLIHYDHGIILLTGPTGSGKTTTLYSALARINRPETNIVTLEDPVEYNLEGVNQIQINPKAGLTFANGLRSILRHDPDIIMVGEIRDVETAEMAIQASLTGHLVFSTLHTNDAPSAITRLLEMGIEPYLVASSVIGIMAQRLVRMNCPKCTQPAEVPAALLREVGLTDGEVSALSLRQGKGCSFCFNTGYYGRTGIFEPLVLSEHLRDLIMARESALTIKREALLEGLTTLRMDGAAKIAAGLTTVAEVLRVTQDI